MKLAVLFRNLGPYHHARLRSLAARFDTVCVEFASEDDEYGWPEQAAGSGYRVHTLAARMPCNACDLAGARQALAAVIGRENPDAIAIPGWSEPLSLAALRIAAAACIPAILMSDSTAKDAPRRAHVEVLKRMLVSRFASAFAAGTRQSDYLRALGIAKDRIALGYDVVDNDHFASGADAARSQGVTARWLRGLPTRYAVCCARLLERKNILMLIRAFRLYRDAVGQDGWDLVLVGDGPMRAGIEAEIIRLDLAGSVRMLGSRSYEELPAIYGLASVFLLPSLSDQWGLAVNEAMAAGLPVLVSSACGCCDDLVEAGVNGFAFDPAETAELGMLLERLERMPNLARFGEASRSRIEAWSLDRFVDGMETAADAARREGPRPVGPLHSALIEALIRR